MNRPNNSVETDGGWLINLSHPHRPWASLGRLMSREAWNANPHERPNLNEVWGVNCSWPKAYASEETKQFFAWLKQARKDQFRLQKMQTGKKQTVYTYDEGPMLFIGQKLVRAMQDAGYPARIYEHWRSPAQQTVHYEKGTTKAKPWQSAHQYGEAVDILHPSKAWSVTNEYWDTLARCVNVVEQQLDVRLTHGWRDWGWDGPHVQLSDFRSIPAYAEKRRPTQPEMNERFEQVLPQVWKVRPSKIGRRVDRSNETRESECFVENILKKMRGPE